MDDGFLQCPALYVDVRFLHRNWSVHILPLLITHYLFVAVCLICVDYLKYKIMNFSGLCSIWWVLLWSRLGCPMQFLKMTHFSNLQFIGEVNTARQLWSILVNAHRLYFQLVVITVGCIVRKCENFMSTFRWTKWNNIIFF